MRKQMLAASLAFATLATTPALAHPPHHAPAHGYRAHQVYDAQGRYIDPRQLYRSDRVWQGRDGRYYCRRWNGTTGLVIGAAVGALLGREIAGRGDRTLGAILGAAGGGLLGRSIDRGELRCR